MDSLKGSRQTADREWLAPSVGPSLVSRAEAFLCSRRKLGWLERFPSLVTAILALKKLGLPKDVVNLIVWGSHLRDHFFHYETEALRFEKIFTWERHLSRAELHRVLAEMRLRANLVYPLVLQPLPHNLERG